VSGGVGASVRRPDGPAKVRGEFSYAGDLAVEGMLIGATLRSPHPHARIIRIDTRATRAMDGVLAVLTADDVPGDLHFGLTLRDEPVLADGVVRYAGEPVAVVAAVDAATARRAVGAIEVEYEPLPAVTDPELARDGEPLHPEGNVYRHVAYSCGDPDARGVVTVENTYRIGMQDPAFLAPEAGLAQPTPDGGVQLEAGRSAAARTSPCRRTPACSRWPPGGR
jgi:CO/xanthine dehydrogenase Mo-binding subunit